MGRILGEHTAEVSLLVIFVATFVTGTTALLCYNCDNIKDNSQCVNVTHCPPGEMCYATSDGLSNGKVVHRTNCTVNHVLPNSTPGRFRFCTQACSEHLCNLGLCSSMENVSRGPHCLSCDLVPSIDDCTNVTQCRDNEICYLQRVTIFGNVRYRMNCVEKQHCQAVHSQPILLGKKKRTITSNDCSMCCDKDNCNAIDCSSTVADTGTRYTFQPVNPEPHCEDTDPEVCATFGLCNTDACRQMVVAVRCPKSCGICEHVIWSTWGQWSGCSSIICATNSWDRYRSCTNIFNVAQHNNCTGPMTESDRHCPDFCPPKPNRVTVLP